MKAAIFDGENVSIKEVSSPKISPTQVLIKVKNAGICGTDLAIAKGNLPTPTPIILGHEFSGKVVKIGQAVNKKWLDKPVTSEINSDIDNECYFCKRDIFTQCISRKAIGIDIDGAFADFIAVKSYLLHELPPTISYKEATFIEPLAAAYQIFEMMPLGEDDKIATVFGLGRLGLLILQVAKAKGLKVIGIDGSNEKLELGRKFGADHLMNRLKTENIPREIKRFTNGLGSDIVIDATGNPQALDDIVKSCRTRGKIHLKSTHGLATPMNLTDIVVREITVFSSRCGPFEKAILGLESGEIKVKELISNEYPLKKINGAFDSYKDRDNIKTVLAIN